MATVADAVELLAAGRPVDAADALLQIGNRVEFLDVDVELVRALEDVLDALPPGDHTRTSRVAARLAFELRGDAGTSDTRRALLDGALSEAEAAGDGVAAAEALLATIHALWEPAGAEERLDAAERVIALSRPHHNVEHELEARLARVNALLEVGRVRDAELELASYARLAAPLDRADLRVFVASRRAQLAVITGRYDDAEQHGDVAAAAAVEAGMPDADRLRMVVKLGAAISRSDDPAVLKEGLTQLRGLAIRMPGHYFDINLAWALHRLGRHEEARIELARGLPALLTTSGYRWLASAGLAAEVAAVVGTDDACRRLYDALLPHQDRLVVLGPMFGGAVGDCLGVLATRLGRLDEALTHLRRTVTVLDENAALPWAAWARFHLASALRATGDPAAADRELAAAEDTARALEMTRLLAAVDEARGPWPSGAWRFTREGDDWIIIAGEEEARFRGARGFDHLQLLVANPRRDIAATQLDGGQVRVESGIAALDEQALAAYRRRLEEIASESEDADRVGDAVRSVALEKERTALLAEVRRATGLGGRTRTTGDAAERARVNVTRNLKRALAQVQRAAPIAGAHLVASVRTGAICRYEPAPGGPDGWVT